MNRTLKIYIFFLLAILVAIIAIDSSRPKPIDWTPTYSINDKIPFGLYVLNKELDDFVKPQKIEKINVTPYEYFNAQFDYDTLVEKYKVKGTFMSISESANFDKQSIEEICYFVSHGNSAFMSAKTLPNALLDSLKLKMKAEFNYNDSLYYWLANPKLGIQKYKLIEGMGNNYFSELDTLNTTVLGYQSGDSTRVNFVKVNFKGGNFYLHTQPAAFTNFHLLKGNHFKYTQKVMSYLTDKDVFWCIKDQNGEVISSSPMRYILSQPALKWAWYIFLIGMVIFMIFNAKRKQRIVPIITPLPNTTIDFTKTIGNLYFQEGDHDNIINKKIIYFLEKIRNEYLIDTTKLDEDFIKKLHLKSGKDLFAIKEVVILINNHRKSSFNSVEEDLLQINNAIEKIIN